MMEDLETWNEGRNTHIEKWNLENYLRIDSDRDMLEASGFV